MSVQSLKDAYGSDFPNPRQTLLQSQSEAERPPPKDPSFRREIRHHIQQYKLTT